MQDADAAHLAAALDADPDVWDDADPDDPDQRRGCHAAGPGGECCRDAGHYDGPWPVDVHVSFDTDQYREWPVGWKPLADRVAAVLDPHFAARIVGSPEYRRGAAAALALVRAVLAPGNR